MAQRRYRRELVLPIAAIGLIVALGAAARRDAVAPRSYLAAGFVAAAIICAVLAITSGRTQPISFYRYSSFGLPISIVLAVMLWTIPAANGTQWYSRVANHRTTKTLAVAGCILMACIINRPRISPLYALADSAAFAVGVHSMDAAYTHQRGWPARMPWGAIHPAARAAYGIVGPHTRIWSIHMHTYCMLPDCDVESHNAFIMTPDWDRLMFGTPEEGREALRRAGVDNFLISTELVVSDPLPASPLFSPDNIGKYLGLRWTDGTASLLTWLGPGAVPLDAEWLVRYRQTVEAAPQVRNFAGAELMQAYAHLRAMPHPWKPFPLPWEGIEKR
jgi:hypothetical protein